jgi:hypothetical protein
MLNFAGEISGLHAPYENPGSCHTASNAKMLQACFNNFQTNKVASILKKSEVLMANSLEVS